MAFETKNGYPMLFAGNRKTLVWGTEDWVVSAVPGSESVITNGVYAGKQLTDVIAEQPEVVLGKQVAKQYANQMPLLAKIIEAHQDLSIQVHPNDEMAMREHGKMGKSEMWYILDAEPGAYLYAGFKKAITPSEFQQIIADATSSTDSSLHGLADVLAKHEVHPGDVFYLPSGRVHAICGGIRLAEIQQSSDVTYRIFDYNRPGLDGKPRELHTRLAAQAIDYTVYPEYKTPHGAHGGPIDEVLDTPFFSIRVVETNEAIRRDMTAFDSFVILMNMGAACRVRTCADNMEVQLGENESCLIPAAIADYQLLPEQGKEVRILEAFIRNKQA